MSRPNILSVGFIVVLFVLYFICISIDVGNVEEPTSNTAIAVSHSNIHDRPLGALLSYSWGNNGNSCPAMFILSFLALKATRTHLIIFAEGNGDGSVCEMTKEQLEANGIFVIHVEERNKKNKGYLNGGQYRLIRFTEWLRTEAAEQYHYIGVLDADLFFQRDIFDLIDEYKTGSNELHLIAENPVERNDHFTVKQCLSRGPCQKFVSQFQSYGSKTGRTFLESFGRTERLNMGTMFGTRSAVTSFFHTLGMNFLHHPKCWDQAVMNVLVWTLSMDPKTTITIWGYSKGIVLTMDKGGIRDNYGRVYNENGGMYAIVHQLKRSRSPVTYSTQFDRMFPNASAVFQERIFDGEPYQRVRLDDNRGLTFHVDPIYKERSALIDPGDSDLPISQSFYDSEGPHKYQWSYRASASNISDIKGSQWLEFAQDGFVVDRQQRSSLCCRLSLSWCCGPQLV